jgi:hypothetical protein
MTQVHMLLQLKKINVDTFIVKMEDLATLIIMEKHIVYAKTIIMELNVKVRWYFLKLY